ncbi:hypothetical protein AB2T96_19190 [Clostridium butyricum]|uniref:hypothetical protein n=1 Tax=Clostridium butyricum TaxID=1492 RepID=UPI0034656C29
MKNDIYTTDELLSNLNIPDFDLFLIISIGSHSFLHNQIDDIYSENKELYYDIFKNSKYYNNDYLSKISASNYKHIQEFCGIYLYEKKYNKDTTFFKLAKKGYKVIESIIKNNDIIDIYELRDRFLEYVSKSSHSSTISSYSYFSIAIYFCATYNKKILCDSFTVNLLKGSFSQIYYSNTFDDLNNSNAQNIKDFIKRYSSLGITKKNFTLPLNDFTVAIGRVYKNELVSNPLIKYSDDKLNELAFKTNFQVGVQTIAAALQLNNIDLIDLLNISSLNYNSLQELLSFSSFVCEDLDISDKSFENYVGMYLILQALIDDYKLIKKNYLVNSYEENLLELSKLKKEYENKITKIEIQEEIQSKTIDNLKIKIADAKNYILQLEKEKNKNNKMILSLENTNRTFEKENKKLTEVINNKKDENSVEIKSSTYFNNIVSFINNTNCIIIGGNINWQNELKKYLPDVKFLSLDDLNRNFNFITSKSIIFFNDSVNSHSMFNKVKSRIENMNIKLLYCTSNTNIMLSLEHIFNELINKVELV